MLRHRRVSAENAGQRVAADRHLVGAAGDGQVAHQAVEAGIEHGVATPAITAALYARFVSQQDDSPTMKAVAAMRNQFGGHDVKKR